MKAKPNILIVDDEPDLLEIMSKRLEKRGYAVRVAENCGDAVEKMKTAKVHVVVLDVMLPDKDGIQCLGEIKKAYPDVAVILLTGHASMQAGIDSLKIGADDYCLKPIGIDDLVEKISIAHRDNKLLPEDGDQI